MARDGVKEQIARQNSHPWTMHLERLKGAVGHDAIERITTQAIFDVLEVPQNSARSGLMGSDRQEIAALI